MHTHMGQFWVNFCHSVQMQVTCTLALGHSITKHSSALYIGMAKALPIIDVLGYDGQNSSFSSSFSPHLDSTPITQKESHIST